MYTALVESKNEFAHSTLCYFPKYIGKSLHTPENGMAKRCTERTPLTSQHVLDVISGERPSPKKSFFVLLSSRKLYLSMMLPHVATHMFDKINSISLQNFVTNKCRVFLNILEYLRSSGMSSFCENFMCLYFSLQQSL